MIPMIARRMIWQEETPPSYADLAQRKATIVRIVPGEAWTRLNAASGGVDDVEIELKFDVDADGLATVAGQASTAMRVACHWCQRVVSAPVTATMHALLTQDEKGAKRAAEACKARGVDMDIVVVSKDVLNAVELMEDELLLSIPGRICDDTACEHRPARSYGDEPVVGENEGTYKPFAALKDLLSSDDTGRE